MSSSSGDVTLKCESLDSTLNKQEGEEEEEDYSEKKDPLFSQKNQIILLKELLKFREKFGRINRWGEFHKMSSLQNHYSKMQISEKLRRLKERFQKIHGRRRPPPFTDHRDTRIYELSKLLWGASKSKPSTAATAKEEEEEDVITTSLPNPEDFPQLSKFFGDDEVPEILKSHWVLMGREAALDFEQRWTNFHIKEVSLCQEKLGLKMELCRMLSEIIHRDRDVLALKSSRADERP